MSTAIIRHGTMLTGAGRAAADIYIEGSVIARIGRDLALPADTVLDASGLLLIPGGIDAHTHLDMPAGEITSADDFETGTVAAAHGGTTTILDFATPEPGESLREGLDRWMAKAESKAVIDYGFHVVLRAFGPHTAAEMRALAGDHGVTSFKMFMAYPGRLMADDGAILRALLHTREQGGLVMIHAENGGAIEVLVAEALRRGMTAPRFHALTRPPGAEAEATARAIALAEMAGAPVFIVHLSSAEALGAVRQGRERGVAAFAETCPQYLCLSDAEYQRGGFDAAKFVMSPPLRPSAHQRALWRGIAARELQTVGTDHCPFGLNDPPHKQLGRDDFSKIPNGAPGIETRLSLLWDAGVRTGLITPERFVEITSAAPAQIFGLWPRKGALAVGSDADIVLWNPEKTITLSASTHHMRVDYSLYEGWTVTGAPEIVLSRGEVIVDRGAFVGRAGRGRYLKRAAPAPA
ncbi:MAG: dihydropyrimidinase [Vicinamibacterales bacterium]